MGPKLFAKFVCALSPASFIYAPEAWMHALRLKNNSSAPMLETAQLPVPTPHDDELLIRVCAAGVTPTELGWYPTTHTKGGETRSGAIPAHEFSGIIAGAGRGVPALPLGTEIFGMNDWFDDGAAAEYCLAKPEHVAVKPSSLTHQAAATVPISALTAWQGLLVRADLKPNERVLIHGGSGAVGLFAVQLARRAGAHVIATGSGRNLDFIRELGADEAIDYNQARFEEVVPRVDVVFDTVGGETLDRSWNILSDPARMVTIASEGASDSRAQRAFFIVEPNKAQLEQIAGMLDRGELKTFIKKVYTLEDAAMAYNAETAGHGKSVVSVNGCAEDRGHGSKVL